MGRHKAKQNAKRKSVLNEPYFHLQEITPITFTQDKVWTAYENDKNLFLHGLAGTGKTFISCYLGMSEVLDPQNQYKNLTIVRSVVPTRDIGFLPAQKNKKRRYTKHHINQSLLIYSREEMRMKFYEKRMP